MKLWDALDLGGACDVDDAYAGEATLVFPCRLAITKELALSEVTDAGATAVHNAHLRHHEEDHRQRDYKIIVSKMDVAMKPGEPFREMVVANCDCKLVEELAEVLNAS